MILTPKIIKIFLILGFALGLLFGSYFLFFQPAFKVGTTSFSQSDVNRRQEILLLYSPDEKRELGKFLLTKSYLNYEIMKKYGVTYSDKKIIAEQVRIEQNTRDPEKLKKIRDLFKGDDEQYRKVFVLPNLVDHDIYYEFYSKNPKLNEETQQKASHFIDALLQREDRNLIALAQNEKLHPFIMKISEKEGISSIEISSAQELAIREPRNLRSAKQKNFHGLKFRDNKSQLVDNSGNSQKPPFEVPMPNSLEIAKLWHDEILSHLKPGDVFDAPVNNENQLLVVKLKKVLSQKPFVYEIEVVAFAKQNFDSWHEAEKRQIPLWNTVLIPPN